MSRKLFASHWRRRLLHFQDGAWDDVQTLLELGLGDGERRSEADDITVCWFGQQAVVPQFDAHIPRIMLCNQPITSCIIYKNTVIPSFTNPNH